MFMPFMPLMDEEEDAFFGGAAAALSAAKASDAEVLDGGPRRSLIWLPLRPVALPMRPAKPERSLPPDLAPLLPPKRPARAPRPEEEDEDPPPPKREAKPPRPLEAEEEDPPPPKREARPPRPLEALLPPPPPRRPTSVKISILFFHYDCISSRVSRTQKGAQVLTLLDRSSSGCGRKGSNANGGETHLCFSEKCRKNE